MTSRTLLFLELVSRLCNQPEKLVDAGAIVGALIEGLDKDHELVHEHTL